MIERDQHVVVRFGSFEVNLRSGELRKHGLKIRLPGQPFRILAILLERPGEVVTREELRKSLWPEDTFVDFEHSLNSAVKKLRTALGDSAENPRYIETLPRNGYRFVAPVDASSWAPPSAPDAEFETATQPVLEEQPPASHGPRRRFLVFGAVLATAALLAFLTVKLRPTVAVPFQTIRATRLTSAGQSLKAAIKAAISPDGRYIAHTLANSGQQSLQVRRATTLHDIEIVPAAPVRYVGITFSPDSETIYYVIRHESQPSVLYRVPVMGGTAQKLKEDLASPVTFSPDGAKYAFVRESANENTLIIADLESGREQRLFSRKLPQVLDYPAWSPDGSLIACTTVSFEGRDARIIGVRVKDGTDRALSPQTWGFIRQLAWLSDRSGLVMTARSRESSTHHVWYVSYPGGAARKVTDGLNNQIGVSVSADSRQLVTVESTILSGIWRMRFMPGEDPQPVVPEASGNSPPRWTPDGRILYEQELNGHDNVWIVDADGTHQKQLTLEGNNDQPAISGSGRIIAYTSDRSGGPAIWTMDADGGHQAMVVKCRSSLAPELSPDGKWIVYATVGSRDWTTLWRVASSGGRATELNDRLWQWPAISPDGKWIAGFYTDKRLSTQTAPDSIAVIPIDGGQPSKLIPVPPSVSPGPIRWSRDGRQISYIDEGKDGDNIWSRPLNGGAPHQLTHLHGLALFDFDWSPDGKQVVFRQGIQTHDVALIQDVQGR